jgi:hypothetical protein
MTTPKSTLRRDVTLPELEELVNQIKRDGLVERLPERKRPAYMMYLWSAEQLIANKEETGVIGVETDSKILMRPINRYYNVLKAFQDNTFGVLRDNLPDLPQENYGQEGSGSK